MIRLAHNEDVAALLAVRRDAIMGIAREYGRAEIERWANAPHASSSRVAQAIRVNRVWVAEYECDILGWIEVRGSVIRSLYVRHRASCGGIGTRLMERGERFIGDSGHRSADLEASPNAEQFYRDRGYVSVGELTANGAIPMEKPIRISA